MKLTLSKPSLLVAVRLETRNTCDKMKGNFKISRPLQFPQTFRVQWCQCRGMLWVHTTHAMMARPCATAGGGKVRIRWRSNSARVRLPAKCFKYQLFLTARAHSEWKFVPRKLTRKALTQLRPDTFGTSIKFNGWAASYGFSCLTCEIISVKSWLEKAFLTDAKDAGLYPRLIGFRKISECDNLNTLHCIDMIGLIL